MSRVQARIDLAAIADNVRVLRRAAGEEARFCAVVKADAYGHGVEEVSRAALAAGADMLAVAAPSEALELRELGIGNPLLVMGDVGRDELPALVEQGCDIATWSMEFAREAMESVNAGPARLHVKFDTGMGRFGTRDRELADALVEMIVDEPRGELVGVMTHFATADEPDQGFAIEQLELFKAFVDSSRSVAPDVIAHAANSAATLGLEGSALDMVRCGLALYGLDPFAGDPRERGLRPALELVSRVSAVKPLAVGESVGYGRRYIAERPTTTATIPIGYADGVRRSLGGRIDVLIDGRRVPVVGTVSMDSIIVDLGPEPGAVSPGDEVVLIGERDGERLLIEDWAREAGTISYEIATGLGGRTIRSFVT